MIRRTSQGRATGCQHTRRNQARKTFPFAAASAAMAALAVLAALAGAPTDAAAREISDCEFLEQVCVDNADRVINGEVVHRTCWRYTSRYRCRATSPEKDRCSAEALPKACKPTKETCLTETASGCALTATDLLCSEYPSGPGITAGKPEVSVDFKSETSPALPPLGGDDGCVIRERRCLSSGPKDIPISNWPNHTVAATPPGGCWRTEIIVSCPAASSAASCEKLEAAGCTPKANDDEDAAAGGSEGKVCEARDDTGACIRWSATYVCPNPGVTGDDIVIDGTVTVPDGGIVENPAECEAKLAEATHEGLACEEKARACTKPGRTEIVNGKPVTLECAEWTVEYACAGRGENGCEALEKLEKDGVCRLEAPLVCEETDETGKCIRSSATCRCGGSADSSVGEDEAGDATLLEKIEAAEAEPADECADFRANGQCVETAKVCTSGPGIRFVDGDPVYKDCWTWTHTYVCASGATDECGRYADDPDCTLIEEKCAEGDERDAAGRCERPVRVYSCRKSPGFEFTGVACEGEACIAGVCTPTDDEPDRDFVNAVVDMEIGREAALYGDIVGNRFFSGEHLACRDRKGAPSCCRSDAVPNMDNGYFSLWLEFGSAAAWEAVKYAGSPFVYDILAYSDSTSWLLTKLYGAAGSGVYSPSLSYWGVTASYSASSGLTFNFSPGGFALAAAMHFYQNWQSCTAEDQRVAMMKGERLCKYVGTTCEKRVGGLGCVETAQHYVCFNSRLARIINEEGRAQIGRGWGTADAPDARGFTLEEMEALDFSAMDLTEFVADVVREAMGSAGAAGIDASAEIARAQKRIEEILAGKLGATSPVPGATGKHALADHAAESAARPQTLASKGAPAFMRDPLEHPTWGPYARPARSNGRVDPTGSGEAR